MLAEVLERSPSLLSKVAARQARSRTIALALARVLELPIQDVFPDIEEYHHPKPLSNTERDAQKAKLAELLLKD